MPYGVDAYRQQIVFACNKFLPFAKRVGPISASRNCTRWRSGGVINTKCVLMATDATEIVIALYIKTFMSEIRDFGGEAKDFWSFEPNVNIEVYTKAGQVCIQGYSEAIIQPEWIVSITFSCFFYTVPFPLITVTRPGDYRVGE